MTPVSPVVSPAPLPHPESSCLENLPPEGQQARRQIADELRRTFFTSSQPTVGPPDLEWEEVGKTEQRGWLAVADTLILVADSDRLVTSHLEWEDLLQALQEAKTSLSSLTQEKNGKKIGKKETAEWAAP